MSLAIPIDQWVVFEYDPLGGLQWLGTRLPPFLLIECHVQIFNLKYITYFRMEMTSFECSLCTQIIDMGFGRKSIVVSGGDYWTFRKPREIKKKMVNLIRLG